MLSSKFLQDLESYKNEIEYELPSKYKPYQVQAANYMFRAKKCFNADEMGLGKTIEAIGALTFIAKKTKLRGLIIAPTAPILNQWSEELRKFSDFRQIIIKDKKSWREVQYKTFNELDGNLVMLINYSKLIKDEEFLTKIDFDAVVFDEATTLKNPSSKVYNVAKKLTKNIEYVFLLTGAPITLNISDFYYMFRLFDYDYLGSYFDEVGWCVNTNGTKKNIKTDGVEEFRKKLSPFYIRREIKDIEGTLDNIKMDFYVKSLEQSKEQKRICNELKKEANKLAREGLYNGLTFATSFSKVASSPYVLNECYEKYSPKILALNDILDTNKKVVCYVKYLKFVEVLEDFLIENKISFRKITGELSSQKQIEAKVDFEKDNYRVLILTGAGKLGLNLQVASTFIFMDIPYNPADVLQYIGRIYRIGQTKDVDVLMFYMKNSIEEDRLFDLIKRHNILDDFFNTDFSKLYGDIFDNNYVRGFLSKNYA